MKAKSPAERRAWWRYQIGAAMIVVGVGLLGAWSNSHSAYSAAEEGGTLTELTSVFTGLTYLAILFYGVHLYRKGKAEVRRFRQAAHPTDP